MTLPIRPGPSRSSAATTGRRTTCHRGRPRPRGRGRRRRGRHGRRHAGLPERWWPTTAAEGSNACAGPGRRPSRSRPRRPGSSPGLRASTPLAKVTMKGTLAASGVRSVGVGRSRSGGRVRGRSRSRIGRRRRSRVCGRLGRGFDGRFRGGLRCRISRGLSRRFGGRRRGGRRVRRRLGRRDERWTKQAHTQDRDLQQDHRR